MLINPYFKKRRAQPSIEDFLTDELDETICSEDGIELLYEANPVFAANSLLSEDDQTVQDERGEEIEYEV